MPAICQVLLDGPHSLSCFILNEGLLSVKSPLEGTTTQGKEVWAGMVDALPLLWSQSIVGKGDGGWSQLNLEVPNKRGGAGVGVGRQEGATGFTGLLSQSSPASLLLSVLTTKLSSENTPLCPEAKQAG